MWAKLEKIREEREIEVERIEREKQMINALQDIASTLKLIEYRLQELTHEIKLIQIAQSQGNGNFTR